MQADPPTQPTGRGYAASQVTKPPNWHRLVAWDMLFNNMTTGLFLAAAIGDLARPDLLATVTRVGVSLALVFLTAALVCLVLDLGAPLRFHHMLRVFKPSSPMSLGTWCLTVFSLPLTAAAGLSLLAQLGWDFQWARILAVLVG